MKIKITGSFSDKLNKQVDYIAKDNPFSTSKQQHTAIPLT